MLILNLNLIKQMLGTMMIDEIRNFISIYGIIVLVRAGFIQLCTFKFHLLNNY